ncbi:uncharacterized protein BX663DRAFT_493514 [Cokeromyces recurvatus]|uniref:uncharacterized protein n=1 Tax=Cokeromyces recurvatus TaxID=90255 RepID=UPI00221FB0FE|nr:uncharacterized protein BX663DRAFT_493514 [Cokeromyces recurvatus]KAI7908247.1 hypothetical protein BX663DRAFT_493514 [Cokeromyces recurvatus]
MFYYNNNPSVPPLQTSEMNPLDSSFESDQFQSTIDNRYNQFDFNTATQPMDVPMQQSNETMISNSFYDTTCLSPIAINTANPITSKASLYSVSPPQFDMTNNCNSNDFITRSPESSSSAESNLVSPPQQYYTSVHCSDHVWPESIPSTTTATPQQNNYYYFTNSNENHSLVGIKRSASVPHNFHKLKSPEDNNSQFQTTPSSTFTPIINNNYNKALPIQIQRINHGHHNHSNRRPVDAETYRRQLDEKLEKVNFDDITVAELKEMLRERGLSASGRKAELMHRLKEEYDMLMRRRNDNTSYCSLNYPNIPQQQPFAFSPSVGLLHHRMAANLNVNSPKRQYHNNNNSSKSTLYHPYSPPTRHSSVAVGQMGYRMASSVPNLYTPSYLNDHQIMIRQPSCLRKPIGSDEDPEQQSQETWMPTFNNDDNEPSPLNLNYYSTVPETNEDAPTAVAVTSTADLWDDQTLQNFLNQI